FDGKRRACMGPDCVVGRPFRVENEDRLAPLAARGDWALRPEALDASALPEALRAELGAYWARLGQMEHASVAAFARFALQLLALGAPPVLVADAQAAMGDELEHARLCFGLAQALSGRAVGPGPLALEGALEGASLGEVVRLAVIEGCVGETLAALEAAESYEFATDASVREVLGRVRADEGRHAELAWRFVAWALEVGGAAAREAAAGAFAQAFDETSGPEGSTSEPGEAEAQALAFGRLPERLRRELRRQALREVVGPCAERLLAASSGVKAAAQGDASSAHALGASGRHPSAGLARAVGPRASPIATDGASCARRRVRTNGEGARGRDGRRRRGARRRAKSLVG
ncbi:MAG TPA: ferritin-like domain-containing protein, partial [Polyangiaceae bacterium]|nr:ferritin-like domain-containing protein [Polyangiaceae bacterium]